MFWELSNKKRVKFSFRNENNFVTTLKRAVNSQKKQQQILVGHKGFQVFRVMREIKSTQNQQTGGNIHFKAKFVIHPRNWMGMVIEMNIGIATKQKRIRFRSVFFFLFYFNFKYFSKILKLMRNCMLLCLFQFDGVVKLIESFKNIFKTLKRIYGN